MTGQQHPYALVPRQAGTGWSYLGWQGWGLSCPATWNPVILSAMWRSGSVVLADLDKTRLELTWRTRPRRQRADLARTIEELAGGMSGRTVRHDLPDQDQMRFQCSDLLYDRDEQVAAVVLASEVTERAAALRLWLAGIDQPLNAAREVIASLRDYRRDEATPWALYDLAFWLPPKFRLADRQMLAGSTRLAFAGRGGGLSFSKVARAADGASQADVVEWFARAHRKDRRWYRRSQQQRRVGRHEGTLTVGRMPWYRWPGQWHRRQLLALCWACPTSGKMFEVQATGWRPDEDLLRRTASGVVCHVPA